MHRVYFDVRFAFTLALLLAAGTAAVAEEGLDLIVVIDRSASMSRDARLGSLLLRMTADLIARNAGVYRIDHRLAVIAFDSTAAVALPLVPVRTANLAQLQGQLARLPSTSRGQTDLMAALAASDRLFQSIAPDAGRRRAILLLTDGVPSVRGTDMAVYRAELQRFVETHFASSGIGVHVLLLAPGGNPPDRALWSHLAGEVRVAGRAPDELLAQAHEIVARLVGTGTSESAPSKIVAAVDTLVVPPYLEVVVFDAFRASPEANVEVFPPGSTVPIRGGIAGVETLMVGSVLSTIVVPRPLPGVWIIRKSRTDARVRILSQQFFPRGVLVRPEPAKLLRQYDRTGLAYRLVDGGGSPIEELRGYPLSLDLMLARPNGSTASLPMERAADLGPAVFRSTREAECDLPGRYWTGVRISAVDAQEHRFEVFRDRWSGFSVVPGNRLSLPPTRIHELRTVSPPPTLAGRVAPGWIPIVFLAIALTALFVRSRKARS